MVFRERLSSPSLYLCPRLRCIFPERMIGRQSKRHKGQRTHIERAVVGVPVGSIGLTATESDGEIAALIEVILLIKHTVENLRQRGSYLAKCLRAI